jgi:hypothetical protein
MKNILELEQMLFLATSPAFSDLGIKIAHNQKSGNIEITLPYTIPSHEQEKLINSFKEKISCGQASYNTSKADTSTTYSFNVSESEFKEFQTLLAKSQKLSESINNNEAKLYSSVVESLPIESESKKVSTLNQVSLMFLAKKLIECEVVNDKGDINKNYSNWTGLRDKIKDCSKNNGFSLE